MRIGPRSLTGGWRKLWQRHKEVRSKMMMIQMNRSRPRRNQRSRNSCRLKSLRGEEKIYRNFRTFLLLKKRPPNHSSLIWFRSIPSLLQLTPPLVGFRELQILSWMLTMMGLVHFSPPPPLNLWHSSSSNRCSRINSNKCSSNKCNSNICSINKLPLRLKHRPLAMLWACTTNTHNLIQPTRCLHLIAWTMVLPLVCKIIRLRHRWSRWWTWGRSKCSSNKQLR